MRLKTIKYIMGKRGPQQQYDFSASEIVLDASKVSSFKSLVSKFNKELSEPEKVYFKFQYKPNTSKVTAVKKTT